MFPARIRVAVRQGKSGFMSPGPVQLCQMQRMSLNCGCQRIPSVDTTSPANQIIGQWSICALSSWWDSLKYSVPTAVILALSWVLCRRIWMIMSQPCRLAALMVNQTDRDCDEGGRLGLFPIAQKSLSENLWSVASWKSDQRIGMVPSDDKIYALHVTRSEFLLFSVGFSTGNGASVWGRKVLSLMRTWG